jgi:hypothetical protein
MGLMGNFREGREHIPSGPKREIEETQRRIKNGREIESDELNNCSTLEVRIGW